MLLILATQPRRARRRVVLSPRLQWTGGWYEVKLLRTYQPPASVQRPVQHARPDSGNEAVKIRSAVITRARARRGGRAYAAGSSPGVQVT